MIAGFVGVLHIKAKKDTNQLVSLAGVPAREPVRTKRADLLELGRQKRAELVVNLKVQKSEKLTVDETKTGGKAKKPSSTKTKQPVEKTKWQRFQNMICTLVKNKQIAVPRDEKAFVFTSKLSGQVVSIYFLGSRSFL